MNDIVYYRENMNNRERMNVLVLGASGAGKSTLIGAVSGARVITGVGRASTKRIDVYESDIWPMRFIDTRGFEYGFFAQRKSVKQVRKFTNEQLKVSDEEAVFEGMGIDAVWYCVEGTARRTFEHNIKLMNKAIKGWKNVPVFAVITKSYSEVDIMENIQAVAASFAGMKKINLQKIIPVVAEEYRINESVTVSPMGLEDLCMSTLNCADTAKKISETNRIRMAVEQKRFTANAIVASAATTAAVIGAVPTGIADSLILVPLETALTKAIFKVYGVKFSADLVAAIVGSAAITNIAKAIISPLEALPIAGAVINGTVAGAIVLTLGEAEIAAVEAIHTGRIDPSKAESVVNFIESKLTEGKIVGMLIRYIQGNTGVISGKSAKDIISVLISLLKKQA